MKTDAWIAITVLMASGCGLTGCISTGSVKAATSEAPAAQEARAAAQPIRVDVFTVRPSHGPNEQLVPAVVSTEASAVVLARRDGTIIRLDAVEGAQVLEGQILGELNEDEAPALLRQTELELKRAKVEEQQCEAAVKLQRSETDRQLALAREGLTTRRDVEQAQSKLDASTHDLNKARLGIEIAQAKVHSARMEADKAQLRATISGMVTRRYVKAGNPVVKGEKLFELSQLGSLEVRFQVPQSSKVNLAPGSILAISRADEANSAATVRIRRIDPVVDPATNSRGYVAEVPGRGLVPGTAIYVHIPLEAERSALWIPRVAFPADSVVASGATGTVYVIAGGGTCAPRTIIVDTVDNERVRIASGLEAGDRVILAPEADLKGNSAIEIVRDIGEL